MNVAFDVDTPLATGLKTLFERFVEGVGLDRPLAVTLAGGMAIHLYAAERVTTDVDAEFSAHVGVPHDLAVPVNLGDGRHRLLHFDTGHNPMLGLRHDDASKDAVPLDIGVPFIELRVLTPVDLVVTKIARLQDKDVADIRSLVCAGLTTADEVEARAQAALLGCLGNQVVLERNVREAVAIARAAVRDSPHPTRTSSFRIDP